MNAITSLPPLYLARHGETVFNRAARLQGQHRDTPLTHAGIAQAHAMGDAVRAHFGLRPDIRLWSSTAGRAQQTAAIVAEHLGFSYFDICLEARLQEIHVGAWENRTYADLTAAQGPILDPQRNLFCVRPPGGEWYDDIARRLTDWLGVLAGDTRPQLVIAHGIVSRVLRGLLVGGAPYDGVAIADDVPQGTMMRLEAGQESPLILGTGSAGGHRASY